MRKLVSLLLKNVVIWRFFRRFLDDVFGLYSDRIRLIKSSSDIDQPSVLDVGCGSGEFASVTQGRYLGIDIDNQYINQAKKLYENDPTKQFLCKDLINAKLSDSEFYMTLLIDFTHHVSDEDLNNIFNEVNTITSHYIVISDPVKQSSNNILGRMLTYLDRGEYIRSEEDLNILITNHFNLLKGKRIRRMGIESIYVLAKPKSKNKVS